MTQPNDALNERQGMRDRLMGIITDSKEGLERRYDEKFGWAHAGLLTAIGAAVMGIGGLVVGAVAGWFALPALAGWAGASIATSAATGTALATGSLLGLNAAGWAGAIGGIVVGALAALVPLSRKTEKTTEYKIQSVVTPDLDEKVEDDVAGRPTIDLRDLPRAKVTETATTKSYRIGDLLEDSLGISTGLVSAFAGAALGASVALIVKVAETRQAIYNGPEDEGAHNKPGPRP